LTNYLPLYTEGTLDAKVMIVGEAWGASEEKVQKPFQGQAGKVLDGILQEVSLLRSQCFITNVIHARPPGNNFKIYYEKVNGGKKQPTTELLKAYERLENEIARCNPNVIVALGNEAMKAVLGFSGVTNWRGSVLRTKSGIKVVPTIHPAAILREWTYRPAVLNDFERAAKESDYAEHRTTHRVLDICRGYDEAIKAIEEAKKAPWCAFDIEIESEQITCIGLAWKDHHAVSIPLSRGFKRDMWRGEGEFYTDEQEGRLIDALRGLLESETPKKIAHNGMFDVEWLGRCFSIKSKLHLDTMLAFHTLYLELPKSLAFLVSLYTDHPYYKYQLKTDDQDTYYRYNATDACLTYECGMVLFKELADEGLDAFYDRYVHGLVEPLLSIQHRGMLFDVAGCKELRKRYTKELEALQVKLDKAVGHELNVGSHKQMTKWLYEELKLPKKVKKRKSTGKSTLSADEEALNGLYAKSKNESIRTVLEIRKRQKILSTYLRTKTDSDGRIRCSYNITGTETGRLSSSENSRGSGTNLQNIPEDIRVLFLADKGKTLINADLSQAEARVVAYLAGETRLIEVFAGGGDIHRKNAAMMFGKAEQDVTGDERFLAKRAVHGLNYGMGYVTFAKECGIDQRTAQRVYNTYFTMFPRLKLWHMEMKGRLHVSRILTTPFGRKRYFFNRWSESLLKEGLAYIPQSTVADVTNQGLIRCYEKGLELLLQVHDSVVLQCDDERLDETVRTVIQCLRVPLDINGKIFTIPVDVKTGKNWKDLKPWTKGS
jgi:uracil-DNA glycosylase family 4